MGNMAPGLSMLADDLTGACDAGVQFALRGFSTVVRVSPQASEDADLVVLPTHSRNDPPEEACRKVRQACQTLLEEGRELIFKKIDSTLYGNIGVEIEAAMEACRFREAFVAPAFPAQGRRVIDGWLNVEGSDRRLYLPALLGNRPGIRWFDAATQEDLKRAAQLAFDAEALPVGSAGLAIEVAALLPVGQAVPPVHHPAQGEVLFVVGSTNPVTLAQVAHLKADHPKAEVITAAELLKRPAPRALVLSGGDTALEVCRALGVRGIRLAREILPGIPLGTLIGGRCDGLTVVTKAGGFGAVDALAAVADSL